MYTFNSTDDVLISHYQTYGDKRAIGILYKRYAIQVFGLCYKYLRREEEARDAVSEIFMIVLEKARHREIYSFKHWLYAVARNYLYSYSRRYTALEMEGLENIPEKFMENEPDLSLYIRERELAHLEQALSSLEEGQKTCLELFYMQDKSYREVAAATGYDLNKVKSHIQNGKRNLKIYFEENKHRHEKGRT